MPRNTSFKGGGGRGGRNKPSRNSSSSANQQQQLLPDEWHNSASPACQRLYDIVVQDLALGGGGVQGTGAQVAAANDNNDAAAATTTTTPLPTPGSWHALVRDYLLWGRPTLQQLQETSQQAVAKKKRKKKKKKNRKSAATATADTDNKSQDEEDEGASSVAATSITEDSTAASSSQPLTVANDSTEEALHDSSEPTTTKTATNPTTDSSPPSQQQLISESAASSSLLPSWHSQRWQRRTAWVDRFLQQYRTTTDPPMATTEITQKMDKFLLWLSTHPSNRVTSAVSTNSNATSSNSKQQEQLHSADDKNNSAIATSPVALIPFVTGVKQAVECIECFNCRHQLQRVLENAVVLSGTQEVVDDVAVSFQYHAMEEGNGKALPPFTLMLIPPPSSSNAQQQSPLTAWRLQRNDESPVVWTRDVLDFWLQEYIILGGLGYDRVVVEPTGTILDHEQVLTLRDQLPQTARETLKESQQCANLLERQATIWRSIDLNMQEPIDMKSPPLLFDMDSALTAVLERILRLVLKLTHAYNRVAMYHTRTQSSIPIMSSRLLANDKAMTDLWDVVLTAFRDIFLLLSTLEGKLLSLADGQGNIPHAYYNAHVRKAFHEYVRGKLGALHRLLDKVTQAIDSQGDTVETVSTVFHTSLARSVYAAYDLLLTVVPHHATLGRKTVLDDACEDILYIVRDWSESYRQNTLEKVVEEHESRRSRLAEAFDRADQIIQMTRKDVVADSPDAKAVETCYLAWQDRDLDTLTITDMTSLRKVRELITEKTGLMIQLLLKIAKYSSGNPSTYPSQLVGMPLYLIQCATTGRIPDPGNAVCSYGAESRAGCLLSSFMFEWMSQRYSEWQAEVAGQELLVDLTATDSGGGNTWSQVARGVKKTAKKKVEAAPKAPAPAPAQRESAKSEPATEGKEDDTSDDEVDEVLLASLAKGESATPMAATASEPVKKKDGGSLVEKAVNTSIEELSMMTSEGNGESVPVVLDHGGQSKNSEAEQSVPEEDSTEAMPEQPEQSGQSASVPPGFSVNASYRDSENSGEVMEKGTEESQSSTPPISSAELDAMIGMGVVDRTGYETAHQFLLSRFIDITKLKGSKVFFL